MPLLQRNWTAEVYACICKEILHSQQPGTVVFDFDYTLIQGDLAFTVLEHLLQRQLDLQSQSQKRNKKNEQMMQAAIKEALDFVSETSPSHEPGGRDLNRDLDRDLELDQKIRRHCTAQNAIAPDFRQILELLLQKNLNFGYRWSRYFFAGMQATTLSEMSTTLFERALTRKDIRIPIEMLELLQTLRQKKWRVAVVTASPELLFSQKILAHFGLQKEQMLGMRLKVNAQKQVEPLIIEPMTSFAGKVKAIQEVFFSTPPDFAFGDSISDVPMLQFAKKGILITRDPATISQIKRVPSILLQTPF